MTGQLYMRTVTPGGRVRYEPTAVPDYDGLAEGAYLLVVEPGCKSWRRVSVSPDYAALLAAARVARGAVMDAIRSRAEPRLVRPTKAQAEAWKACQAVMAGYGEAVAPLVLRGASLEDLADAVEDALLGAAAKVRQEAGAGDQPIIAPVEWCWMERDGERCHGPFASRDEAIHDACGYDLDAVLVGKVKRYLGDELMPVADDLLEQVNERAFDNGFGWLDDMAFDFRETEAAAQADLTAWARKHLGTIYWTIEDEEAVRLRVGHR